MNETQNNANGIVYVLSNRGFWLPEREDDSDLLPIVKIGYTTPATPEALRKRMNDLFKTGVALPFDLEYAKAVASCAGVENNMHTIFSGLRVNPSREFFRVEVESVIAALEPYAGEEITLGTEVSDDVTQSDIDARDRVKKVRRELSFKYLQIQKGEKLEYLIDPNEIATVVSDTKVEHNGKIMTPAAAATMIFNKDKTGEPVVHCSSFSNWRYGGKTLQQIRDQIDAESKPTNH